MSEPKANTILIQNFETANGRFLILLLTRFNLCEDEHSRISRKLSFPCLVRKLFNEIKRFSPSLLSIIIIIMSLR